MEVERQGRNPESEPEAGFPYIPPPSQPSPDDLRSQARQMRQVSTGSIRPSGTLEVSLWAKLAALFFFGLVIAGVSYLLVDKPARRQLAVQAGEVWAGLYGHKEDHLLRLPPPSRQATISQVINASTDAVHFRTPAAPAAADENRDPGILWYNVTPEEALKQASGQSQAPYSEQQAPAEKTPAATAAFEFLKENSAAARQLVAGEVEGYQFKEWRPVRNEPPRYLISLLATDGQGQEVSLIWEVEMEKQQVRAMSQQARELAARIP